METSRSRKRPAETFLDGVGPQNEIMRGPRSTANQSKTQKKGRHLDKIDFPLVLLLLRVQQANFLDLGSILCWCGVNDLFLEPKHVADYGAVETLVWCICPTPPLGHSTFVRWPSKLRACAQVPWRLIAIRCLPPMNSTGIVASNPFIRGPSRYFVRMSAVFVCPSIFLIFSFPLSTWSCTHSVLVS